MVVVCKVLGSALGVWLVMSVSACSGPSCLRQSDCPRGQSCVASSCQGPSSGAAGTAAGSSAAGTSGGAGQAGQMESDAGGQVSDAGPGDAGQTP